MKRLAPVLVAWGLASLATPALAQQPLPALPPSPPAPPAAPAPAPATAPAPPPASPGIVDATNAPPTVTNVATPAPEPYAPMSRAPERGAYEHDGFYLRFDTGFGALGFGGSAASGASPSLGGGSSVGSVKIGGTPARGFVVGGMLEGKAISNARFDAAPAGAPVHGWSAAVGTLGAFVDWFPSERRGWHVGGEVGLSGVAIGNDAAQISWVGGALSTEVFGGYDFWVGPEWSFGVEGLVGLTSRAKMQDSHGTDVGYQLGAIDFGIAATILYH